MFGPLFQLQWVGLLCPCLQKEEDRNARQALTYINTAGIRILWIRSSASSSSVGFSLGNFFRSSSSTSSSDAGSKNSPARLSLGDNSNGLPEILVDPTAVAVAAVGGDATTIASAEDALGGSPNSSPPRSAAAASTSSIKLNIKLGRVDRVTLDGEDIVLKARPVKASTGAPKELLRLRLLNFKNVDMPVKQEDRNMFLHHMAVLVEWERQRRAKNKDDYDDDDDDDEDQPNFLQAKASKAAHFAKRELEMQQTKREREQRKAKLVAESGGLKYTALAMASRIDT